VQKTLFLVSFFLLTSCQILLVDGKNFQLNDAIFDFSNLSPSNAAARLDGVWEWVPNQFIDPNKPWNSEQSLKIKVPSRWNSYLVNNEHFPSFGFATYRIFIKPPPQKLPYGIKITSLGSAFEFYANGVLLAKAGELSENGEAAVPAYAPQVVTLPATNEGWDIRILVSNWHHRDGGLFYSLFFGKLNDVISLRQNLLFLDIFIFASLIITAIYNLSLYFFLKRDKSPLWFSLICVTFAVRAVVYGEYLVLSFIPQLDWQILQKAGYLTLYLAPLLFFLFIKELINNAGKVIIPRVLIHGVAWVALAASLFTFFFPMYWFSQLQIPYQIWIGVLFVVLIYYLLRAIKNGFSEGYWFLWGLLVLFLTVINDALHTAQIINTTQISPMGFLAFLLSQSFLLTQNFSKAFIKVDRLSQSLELTNKALSRFVPTEFLMYLGKESITDIQLGDHVEHKMAVLFSDIRSFTQLSEKMIPSENFKFINSYLKRITPPIRHNGGFIDKFMGDGVMALFPNKSFDAIKAGIDMLECLRTYNQHRKTSGYDPIDIGIGIHTGTLMMGTIGNEFRMDSTVIADAVNLASRLENLNRLFGTHMLVSLESIEDSELEESFAYRFLGFQKIKGKEAPLPIFEVFENDPQEIKEQKQKIRPQFEEAIQYLVHSNLKEARKLFKKLKKLAPLDTVVEYYCRQV